MPLSHLLLAGFDIDIDEFALTVGGAVCDVWDLWDALALFPSQVS